MSDAALLAFCEGGAYRFDLASALGTGVAFQALDQLVRDSRSLSGR